MKRVCRSQSCKVRDAVLNERHWHMMGPGLRSPSATCEGTLNDDLSPLSSCISTMHSARLSFSANDILQTQSPRALHSSLPTGSPILTGSGSIPLLSPHLLPIASGSGSLGQLPPVFGNGTESEEWMKELPFKAKDLVEGSMFVEIDGGQTVEAACQVSCSLPGLRFV